MDRSRWDERLITPEQALGLAGDQLFYFDVVSELQLIIRCAQCYQGMGVWRPGPAGFSQQTSVVDIMTAVLRHLVMAHDLPLNQGGGNGGNRGGAGGGGDHRGPPVQAAGDGSPGGDDLRGAAAAGGPGDQAGHPGRVGEAAEGDR